MKSGIGVYVTGPILFVLFVLLININIPQHKLINNKTNTYKLLNLDTYYEEEKNSLEHLKAHIYQTNNASSTNTMKNPSRREILRTMSHIGQKYNIPPEILFAIGYAESEFTQFKNGKPYIDNGGIGIMQVMTTGYSFDVDKAKYDYKYNIEIGALILIDKWNMQNTTVSRKGEKGNLLPVIGDKNPLILENWYFVLWAYNGYSAENNPNELPIRTKYGLKKKAYQERVINLAKTELGIEITPIAKDLLPDRSLPKVGTKYETPQPIHISMIAKNNYSRSDKIAFGISNWEGIEYD